MALSVRAGMLTARTLAHVLREAAHKMRQGHRARDTPHGRQTVGQLMRQGTSTNSIEITGAPRDFDRVARRWNVDYAFYKTGPDKYLLFFKSGQADAITTCFYEYSKRVLNRSKTRRIPIREQLRRAVERVQQQTRQQTGAPEKSQDFSGRGAATERADFGGTAAEGAERSLWRRTREAAHEDR